MVLLVTSDRGCSFDGDRTANPAKVDVREFRPRLGFPLSWPLWLSRRSWSTWSARRRPVGKAATRKYKPQEFPLVGSSRIVVSGGTAPGSGIRTDLETAAVSLAARPLLLRRVPTDKARQCNRAVVQRSKRTSFGAPPMFLRPGTIETPVMERKKTGRPSKGQRREVRARVPVSLFDALHEEARRRGMTINDIVGEQLAALVGVPYSPQEALSLSA